MTCLRISIINYSDMNNYGLGQSRYLFTFTFAKYVVVSALGSPRFYGKKLKKKGSNDDK